MIEDKIKVLIVDDEQSACDNLRYLLQKFVPAVEVVGEANAVDDAIKIIEHQQPNLVFLDIEMPRKNGFQLINYFEKIDFQVIFVTAYESYAIQAFEVAALDYLLKPIDVDRLQNAVEKFVSQENKFQEKFNIFKKVITSTSIETIAVSFKGGFTFVNTNAILSIEASRSYASLLVKTDAGIQEFISSKNLLFYEELLENNSFFRVHRSWLVNLKHISYYSKKESYLILANDLRIPVGKSFKSVLEKLILN